MRANHDVPGPMGWGDENDTPAKALYRERLQQERNYDELPACFVQPRAPEPSPLAERITGMLEFDAGYAFWPVEEIIYGEPLWGRQRIGDCVGFSHALLLASRAAEELAIEGDYEGIAGSEATSIIPHVGYSYGVGRVYVGNGRIRGDGSLCSWQIRGTLDYGWLPCDTEGLDGEFPEPAPGDARQWGRSRSLLDQWRPHAEPYQMVNSWDVESPEDLYRAIVELRQPCQICSRWGFAPGARAHGMQLYRRSGQWPHSMGVLGLVCVGGTGEGLGNGGEWFVPVRNQWGKGAHRDVGRKVPAGYFMVTIDTFARWVKDAHCAAIGELVGRQLDIAA